MPTGGVRTWWLLAVAALEAAAAVLYFQNAGHGFHLRTTVPLLGRLALATGACGIAAGVRTAPRDWLLGLNGLAFGVLGLVLTGVFGFRIGFRVIAFLILATAISMAAVEWKAGRILRLGGRHSRGIIFAVAALLLLLFGGVFAAMALTGVRSAPGSHSELFLLGAYFTLSAASVLTLIWGSRELNSGT